MRVRVVLVCEHVGESVISERKGGEVGTRRVSEGEGRTALVVLDALHEPLDWCAGHAG